MDDKNTARARHSRTGPGVVAPGAKVNIALPLSVFKVEEPMKLRAGDWISLAALATSVVGFSVVIRKLIRTAPAQRSAGAPSRIGQARPMVIPPTTAKTASSG